jgi:hypothetical protein
MWVSSYKTWVLSPIFAANHGCGQSNLQILLASSFIIKRKWWLKVLSISKKNSDYSDGLLRVSASVSFLYVRAYAKLAWCSVCPALCLAHCRHKKCLLHECKSIPPLKNLWFFQLLPE